VDGPVRALLARLAALGIARADVQTPAVELRRITVRSRGRRLVRYEAASLVEVRTGRIGLVDDILAAATSSGATLVSGPEFSVQDDTEARLAATRTALERARRRADAAAAVLGLRVVGVRSVELDPGQGVAERDAAPEERAAAAPPPVEPGREPVSATVVVVFTLGV